MKMRIRFGKFLIRLGNFIQSLAVIVMHPNDLIEFSKQTYSKTENIELANQKEILNIGLYPDEVFLLDKLPIKKGRLLLLCIGSGREALPLAKSGFNITGVDFVPELVNNAVRNLDKEGIKIKWFIQDISKLDVEESFYDVVWLSSEMYSSIPGRKKRVETLEKIRRSMVPGGHFICQFYFTDTIKFSTKIELIKKAFCLITMGNFKYQKGDILSGNVEFIHGFSSRSDLELEFKEGGFEIMYFKIFEDSQRGGAYLRKPLT